MSTILFNEFGSVEMATDPLGRTTQAQYDVNQNITRLTTAAGTSCQYTYDNNGDLIRQVNPLGDVMTMTYTTGLQLSSVTDSDGHTTKYAYSAAGDLTSMAYADGSSAAADYNALGLPKTTTNARGQATTYQYNADGLITQQTFADGTKETFTYDARGHVLTTTDATGTTNYTYNAAGQLTSVAYPTGQTLLYSYDNGGRRTRLVDSTSGFTVNYTYDALGRLASMTDAGGATLVTYKYDAVGRLAEQDDANGTYTTYAYDANGNLLHLINYGPGGVVQTRFDYTYDALNDRTGEATVDGTWTYTYDADGRLTHAVFASTNAAVANQDLSYTYDAAGNRVKTVINGVTTNYSINNRNEYTTVGGTTYQYDADGNLISQTDSSGTTTFTYNSFSELTKVVTPTDTWAYQYNAVGERVSATHNGQEITYVLDPVGGTRVVAAYDGAGHLVADYAYGLVLVSQNGATSSDYYQFDGSGSTAAVTSALGAIQDRYSYLPFGEQATSSEDVRNPFQYMGQFGVMTAANGLTGTTFRFYSPGEGRFLTTDPLGIRGSFTNLYSYANNSPVSLSDPLGLGDQGYFDYGFSFGFGVGATVGIQLGSGGFTVYGGVGLATPGISFSSTMGDGSVSASGRYIQAQAGIGAGIGASVTDYWGLSGEGANTSGQQLGVGLGLGSRLDGFGVYVVDAVHFDIPVNPYTAPELDPIVLPWENPDPGGGDPFSDPGGGGGKSGGSEGAPVPYGDQPVDS
jgi:RHS repeat-associated protein